MEGSYFLLKHSPGKKTACPNKAPANITPHHISFCHRILPHHPHPTVTNFLIMHSWVKTGNVFFFFFFSHFLILHIALTWKQFQARQYRLDDVFHSGDSLGQQNFILLIIQGLRQAQVPKSNPPITRGAGYSFWQDVKCLAVTLLSYWHADCPPCQLTAPSNTHTHTRLPFWKCFNPLLFPCRTESLSPPSHTALIMILI